MSPYIIIASVTAKEGCAEKIQQHLIAIKDDVKKNEPGTLQYQPVRDVNNPNKFVVFEEYESVHAHEAHREGKPYQKFKDELPEIADGGIGLQKLESF